MNLNRCSICDATMSPLFTLQILGKYDVAYFYCRDCGFTRTEEPYWLEEAYSDAISVTDTGILKRNWALSAKLACILFFCMRSNGTYVDVAGGYGILTRLMRDYGFNYYWEDKYCQNLLAKCFESPEGQPNITALSGFEVLEHTINPVEFVSGIMIKHQCRTFVFSTEIYASDAPPRPDWWYLSTASGQHISFFQLRTLKRIADRLKLRFYSTSGLHIFTDHKLRSSWLLPLLRNSTSSLLARLVSSRLGSLTDIDHANISARLSKNVKRESDTFD